MDKVLITGGAGFIGANFVHYWAERHPEDVRVMAYGLLRLPERDGRWALSEPVIRMIELVYYTEGIMEGWNDYDQLD